MATLQPAAGSLFDRALRRLVGAFREVTGAVAEGPGAPAALLAACLAGKGLAVSARGRAGRLAQLYLSMELPARRAFLLDLAACDADPSVLWAADVAPTCRVYGARIDEADVKPIVDHLAAAHGR